MDLCKYAHGIIYVSIIIVLAASVFDVQYSPVWMESFLDCDGESREQVKHNKTLLNAQLEIFEKKFESIGEYIESVLPEPKDKFRGHTREIEPFAPCTTEIQQQQNTFNVKYNSITRRVNQYMLNITKKDREARESMPKKDPEKLISKSNKI